MDTLLEARPAYAAALGSSFQVVQATEVTDANLEKGKTTLPWFGPKWVGTKAPEGRYDIDAVEAVTEIGGGRGHFPQLHIPYDLMAKEVLEKSRPISELIAANSGKTDDVRAWLSKNGHDENSARFQPIRIRASEFAVILDSKSGAVVGTAPFKPQQ